MDMEATDKFPVSLKATDNPSREQSELWSSKAMEKLELSSKDISNQSIENPLSWSPETIGVLEAMEKPEVSLKATRNSFREKPASLVLALGPNATQDNEIRSAGYISSTSSHHPTNQKKEHVMQLLWSLIYQGEDISQSSHQKICKPPKGSPEDELLLLIENFSCLNECLEATVQKMKVLFPSSDSEYIDAWGMTCRGIQRLQEGLSIMSNARKLVCPPKVNQYPKDY